MDFVKSSFSTSGACVEAAYVRSSFCASGTCMEAAPDGGLVLIRDSKHPDGTVLEVPHAAWYGFLDAIRAGEFDDLS